MATKLESIRAHAGLRNWEIAQLVDTTPQTVSRWQTGQVEPHAANLQNVLALEWLADQLAEFFPPDEARVWLFSRHRLLAGDRPSDRIQRGDSDDVLALIVQLRDGAYL